MQRKRLLRDTRKSLLAERRGKGRYQRLATIGYRFDGAAFCKRVTDFT